jgi:cation:H+ antiporter
MTDTILAIAGGLVLLGLGGEALVRGAVGIAAMLRLSTMVTGVVIVGAATSMPELVASVQAAMEGSPGIAWGNIVGSNIANTLLILGATALIAPFALTGAGKRDAISGFAAVAVLGALAFAGWGSLALGIALLAALTIYIVWRVKHPRKSDAQATSAEEEAPPPKPVASIAFFAIGLAMLVLGGNWLVTGAIDLARIIGISEAAIGLTVVAIGTSLPELAASLVAAWRGQAQLALGNVVGSNVFNLLLIGGVTMLLAPQPIPRELLRPEWVVLGASALALVLLCAFARNMPRWLGALFVLAFGANTAFVLAA